MKTDRPIVVPLDGGTVHNILGAPYRFIMTSDETGGAFALIEVTAAPQSAVPLHVHTREDEMFYVLEGTLELQSGGRIFQADKGSTVFLPRKIPHAFGNRGKTDAKFLALITPGGFERFLEEVSRLPANEANPETLNAIGRKYGMELLPPGNG